MAVPKRRTSSSRKNKRRTHKKLNTPNISYDPNIGEYTVGHRISPNGYYKGRKVLDKE